jgi:putative tricarboxylic transport membrane protein
MRNRGDIIGGVLLILLGIGVLAEAFRLGVGTLLIPQPGFFPFLGGFLLITLSIVLLAQGLLGRGKNAQAFGEMRRPAILVAIMAVYVGVLDPLGYVLSTIVIAAVILRVLGVTSWKVVSLASLALAVGTYVLFARILGIELPSGVLPFLG